MEQNPYLRSLAGSALDSRVDARRLGVWRRCDLVREGVGIAGVRSAVRSRSLLRLRQGWYAEPQHDPDIVAAVRAGGALSGLSLLRLAGVWTLPREKLDVRVSVSRALPGNAEGVRLIRAGRGGFEGVAAADPPFDALRAAARLVPVDELVAACDSLLNAGRCSVDELRGAFRGSAARLRRAVELADGRAQSGTESLARVRFGPLAVVVEPQCYVPGVGFADLRVGERLLVECDSRAYHDDDAHFTNDRRRDLACVALGFLVLRPTYADIVYRWAAFEAQVRTIIRAGQHRWTPSTRRMLVDGIGADRAERLFRRC